MPVLDFLSHDMPRQPYATKYDMAQQSNCSGGVAFDAL